MVAVPERGDLVWLRFEPQAGREIRKTRPALVLTPAAYNRKTHLCIACPITSQVKGYPFEVALPADLELSGRKLSGRKLSGVVLADQAKSLDWHAREATVVGQAPPQVVDEVLGLLSTLLGV
jgi:mRNA interferase MazF